MVYSVFRLCVLECLPFTRRCIHFNVFKIHSLVSESYPLTKEKERGEVGECVGEQVSE